MHDANQLTPTQAVVFDLLGHGLETKQIAGRLGVSRKTVESHIMALKDRLDCDGLRALVVFAVETRVKREMAGGGKIPTRHPRPSVI